MFLKQAKMQLDFTTSQTTWVGSVVPFHSHDYSKDKLKIHQVLEHESVHSNIAKSDSTAHVTVKDAIYNVHDPDKVAASQLHLTKEQHKEIAAVFRKCKVLFSGQIGCYEK
jgi:hypothetical protein